MTLEVRIEEIQESELPLVDYRWDADTDILSAALRSACVAEGLSGSLDIEGSDGAWLMLEMQSGLLTSVEVAVWPDVKAVAVLSVPVGPAARLRMPARDSQPGVAAIEVDTSIRAVADQGERTIHFRIGPNRTCRALRVARDLIVEVDGRSRIAGLWLLNVPPFPEPS